MSALQPDDAHYYRTIHLQMNRETFMLPWPAKSEQDAGRLLPESGKNNVNEINKINKNAHLSTVSV